MNDHLVLPKEAEEYSIRGRVVLQFTVDLDGSVSNVKVVRSAHPCLDKEAVRVVSQSPKWTPGEKDGVPIAVTYTFPVIFGY